MWWLKICKVYVTTINLSIVWQDLIVFFCACPRFGTVDVRKFLTHLAGRHSWQFAMHVANLPPNRWVKRVLLWNPTGARTLRYPRHDWTSKLVAHARFQQFGQGGIALRRIRCCGVWVWRSHAEWKLPSKQLSETLSRKKGVRKKKRQSTLGREPGRKVWRDKRPVRRIRHSGVVDAVEWWFCNFVPLADVLVSHCLRSTTRCFRTCRRKAKSRSRINFNSSKWRETVCSWWALFGPQWCRQFTEKRKFTTNLLCSNSHGMRDSWVQWTLGCGTSYTNWSPSETLKVRPSSIEWDPTFGFSWMRKIVYNGAWNAGGWPQYFPMPLADRSLHSKGGCVSGVLCCRSKTHA